VTAALLAPLAIRGTIVLSTIAWASAEYVSLMHPDRWRAARTLWTAGALLAAAHAVAALHIVYGWDQQAAVAGTARQTAALTGLDWGGGLYVNYAFITLWLTDAAFWWRFPARYLHRTRLHSSSLRAIFLFMFINGAIVFASGPGRAIGAIAVVTVIAAWTRSARSTSSHDRRPLKSSAG
jgi:hypothetical protein